MNREECIAYLEDLKRRVAPAYYGNSKAKSGEKELEEAKHKYEGRLMCSIIGLGWYFWRIILGNATIIYTNRKGNTHLGGLGGVILFLGLIIIFLYLRNKRYIKPAEQKISEGYTAYWDCVRSQEYLAGKSGFPQKYYNYRDINKMLSYFKEGRADNMKEAFLLLEGQISRDYQKETIRLQKEAIEAANNAAAAADAAYAASMTAAYNADRVARNTERYR
jgi:hypothetical protein